MKRRDFVRAASLCVGAATSRAHALRMPVDMEQRVPVLYVAHGGPNLAVSETRGAELRAWGAMLPAPRGIVAITPHVRSERLQLSAMGVGRALMSFPARFRPARDFDYPSPDSRDLADEVAGLLETPPVRRGGGLNHTVWQPLLHMRPEADTPVVQLALPFHFRDRALFELGNRLAPLRARGHWILCSGNLTHNLAMMRRPTDDVPWARRFDEWVRDRLIESDVDAIVDWRRAAPDADLAHPDDGGHFDVLLVGLGAAAVRSPRLRNLRFPVEGFEMGSLSKRCIQLG